MVKNDRTQLKMSSEERSDSIKSLDYQILFGDNSLCDPNLSQDHSSQSQRGLRTLDSSTTTEFHEKTINAFPDYISSPHQFLLILFVIIYILLILFGASVFSIFEQKAEFQLREHILRVQHNFLTTHPCVDPQSLDDFLSEVLKAYDNGVNLNFLNKLIKQKQSFTNQVSDRTTDSIKDSPTPTTTQRPRKLQNINKVGKRSAEPKWKRGDDDVKPSLPFKVPTEYSNWEFTSSLLYVTSVVTTIGYGHVTPITAEGKVFSLAFSCVSIPFTLVFLSIFVSLLKNGPVKKLEKLLIRTINKNCIMIREFFIRILHVIIVTLILMIIILFIPALIFSRMEEWTFFDSFYYCYISLTTVGLGDFVAAQNHLLYSPYLQIYRIGIVCYLYTGLVLIMLWIAVILRIPQLNLKPFLLTEKEEIDEQRHIIDYEESPHHNYGTHQHFFPQK